MKLSLPRPVIFNLSTMSGKRKSEMEHTSKEEEKDIAAASVEVDTAASVEVADDDFPMAPSSPVHYSCAIATHPTQAFTDAVLEIACRPNVTEFHDVAIADRNDRRQLFHTYCDRIRHVEEAARCDLHDMTMLRLLGAKPESKFVAVHIEQTRASMNSHHSCDWKGIVLFKISMDGLDAESRLGWRLNQIASSSITTLVVKSTVSDIETCELGRKIVVPFDARNVDVETWLCSPGKTETEENWQCLYRTFARLARRIDRGGWYRQLIDSSLAADLGVRVFVTHVVMGKK